jgi:hypothetical protein
MATCLGATARILPVETLKAIVDLVDDKRDLATLALVNTTLTSLATPKLYKEGVTLGALGVLLARPDLALLVKTASIEDLLVLYADSTEEADEQIETWGQYYAGLSRNKKASKASRGGASPDDSDLPLMPTEEQIEEFALDDGIVGALKRKLPNARAALFLHLLPSLQELKVDGRSNDWSLEFDRFFAIFPEPWSPPTAAGLRSLTSLSISWEDQVADGGFRPDFVVRLLALPRLRTLRMTLVRGHRWPRHLEARLHELHGTSSVTDLAFTHSGIAAPVLAQLLRIPRALRSFEYVHSGWGADDLGQWGPGAYTPGSIGAALAPARKTLVKLVVDDPQRKLGTEAIGSLDGFKQLMEIRVPV